MKMKTVERARILRDLHRAADAVHSARQGAILNDQHALAKRLLERGVAIADDIRAVSPDPSEARA